MRSLASIKPTTHSPAYENVVVVGSYAYTVDADINETIVLNINNPSNPTFYSSIKTTIRPYKLLIKVLRLLSEL
jgi:hypothetical protein